MRGFGRLDNMTLDMGLSMSPGQVIGAKHASLDGLELNNSKILFIAIILLSVYCLKYHG